MLPYAGLAATHPLEDADARTIFVSNVISHSFVASVKICKELCSSPYVNFHVQVHFAATKDSLSRHFNKFGDVVKVIIVTDATTGQPKG